MTVGGIPMDMATVASTVTGSRPLPRQSSLAFHTTGHGEAEQNFYPPPMGESAASPPSTSKPSMGPDTSGHVRQRKAAHDSKAAHVAAVRASDASEQINGKLSTTTSTLSHQRRRYNRTCWEIPPPFFEPPFDEALASVVWTRPMPTEHGPLEDIPAAQRKRDWCGTPPTALSARYLAATYDPLSCVATTRFGVRTCLLAGLPRRWRDWLDCSLTAQQCHRDVSTAAQWLGARRSCCCTKMDHPSTLTKPSFAQTLPSSTAMASTLARARQYA